MGHHPYSIIIIRDMVFVAVTKLEAKVWSVLRIPATMAHSLQLQVFSFFSLLSFKGFSSSRSRVKDKMRTVVLVGLAACASAFHVAPSALVHQRYSQHPVHVALCGT